MMARRRSPGDLVTVTAFATACQTCHGMDGLSKLPKVPNLAEQEGLYLVKALTKYRDGKRENEIMNVVAKGPSDIDIANLAANNGIIQIDVSPVN